MVTFIIVTILAFLCGVAGLPAVLALRNTPFEFNAPPRPLYDACAVPNVGPTWIARIRSVLLFIWGAIKALFPAIIWFLLLWYVRVSTRTVSFGQVPFAIILVALGGVFTLSVLISVWLSYQASACACMFSAKIRICLATLLWLIIWSLVGGGMYHAICTVFPRED